MSKWINSSNAALSISRLFKILKFHISETAPQNSRKKNVLLLKENAGNFEKTNK